MVVIADALLVVDFDQQLNHVRHLAALAQPADRFIEHGRRLHQQVRLLHEGRVHRLDVKQGKPLGQGIDGVDDVVKLPHQCVNVFAVKRSDERSVQPLQGLVGKLVGGVFFVPNAGQRRRHFRKAFHELAEVLGGTDCMACHPLKHVVKRRVPGQQIDHQCTVDCVKLLLRGRRL
jgi:hypothetical protein